MRSIVSILLFSSGTIALSAQNHLPFLLNEGTQHQINVIYTPQTYIGEELNRDALVVGTSLGSVVVSPFDAIVTSFHFIYKPTLSQTMSFSEPELRILRSGDNNKTIKDFNGNQIDPRYVSLSVGLRVAENETYYFTGLEPICDLPTGTRIRKGDTIGVVAFSYKGIREPSVMISRSVNGRSADPMTPFGLKTTFKPAPPLDPFRLIAVEQLKHDLEILRLSLEEGHPGLYDYSSKQIIDDWFIKAESGINDSMNVFEFTNYLEPLLKLVRDRHTTFVTELSPESYAGRENIPPQLPVFIGWEQRKLMVTRATPGFQHLIGMVITEINGVNADTLLILMNKNHYVGEGFVESLHDFYLLTTAGLKAFDYIPAPDGEYRFVFSDGSSQVLYRESLKKGEVCIPILPAWKHHLSRSFRDISYHLISAETAFLDIGSFELLATDLDEIKCFIKQIIQDSVPDLIIDVRNNRGGYIDMVVEIFSMFAWVSFRLKERSMVNQNDTYSFSRHTDNYAGIRNIFPDYVKDDYRDGYWLPDEMITENNPSDEISFTGNIYLLVNEHSYSAASLFAALMHKYRRALIIGRETGNPYHQMFSEKYARLILPNSRLVLRFPLVKTIFCTAPDSIIPFGRGVLPFYPVELLRQELDFVNDPFTEKALSLIAEGVSITSLTDADSLAFSESKTTFAVRYWYISLIIIVFGFLVYYLLQIKRTAAKG